MWHGLNYDQIVPQYSAIMGHRKEIDIGLDADHADLCKFKAPNETNYVRLETQIKHLAKIITKGEQISPSGELEIYK